MDQDTALLLLFPLTKAVKKPACPADRVMEEGVRDNEVDVPPGNNDITALPICREPAVAISATVCALVMVLGAT